MMQTYWLLLAVSQDQPKNKYVAELRDCCERAALEGSWVHDLPCMPSECHCSCRMQSMHDPCNLQPVVAEVECLSHRSAALHSNGALI